MIRLPIIIIFSFCYLYSQLGNSFFFGILVFVSGFYINLKLNKARHKMWRKLRKNYEKRIEITDEALKNVQTLKLNSWTGIW